MKFVDEVQKIILKKRTKRIFEIIFDKKGNKVGEVELDKRTITKFRQSQYIQQLSTTTVTGKKQILYNIRVFESGQILIK